MKIPLFSITPLIESYYIEQIGSEKITTKESKSIKKSEKTLSKSIDDPIKWIYVEFEGHKSLVLMKKSNDNHVFLTGPLRLKKAKTEKDLEYWKRKLLDVLSLQKSLSDILPDGIPDEAQGLLLKARKYPVGTIRTWKGKDYKKVGENKWVTVSRGKSESRDLSVKTNIDLSSFDDFIKWYDAKYEDYEDSQEWNVKKSVLSYVGGEYPEIQKYLKSGKFEGNEKIESIVNNIKEYIKKAPPIDNGILLYRGTISKKIADLNIGDSFHSMGFTSFTTNPDIAQRFIEDPQNTDANNKVIIKTITSDKNRIVPVPNITEQELLLETGKKFRIIGKEIQDKYIVLEIEIGD